MRVALFAIFLASYGLSGADSSPVSESPRYTSDGRLQLPKDYREWIFLSSGLGMVYGPLAAASHDEPMFDNVYVNRPAYQAFLASGRWPDKTVLVLEVRGSQSKGSINRGGHFQTNSMGVEIHVKDEKRFPGKWAFFGFDNGGDTAKMIPTSESCYSCHEKSGAVDTTFVQFYPTLLNVARVKNTLKQGTE
jgi:hypothetical protein